jgi:hypothetical protein
MTITTILDTFCAERQQHDTDARARDNSKFRVSDAGKCRLMRYWKRQGKPMDPHYTPEGLRAMHVGILIHNWIQAVIKNAGIALAIEQQLEDKHRIGHLDALVDIDGQRILYDFKTVNGKKWFYLEKNNFRPDLQHICQIITYAEMLADFPDQMNIIYLNRDTINMAECNVILGIWQDKVKRDWDILITSWERKQSPAQTTEPWECGYCGYQDRCPYKNK